MTDPDRAAGAALLRATRRHPGSLLRGLAVLVLAGVGLVALPARAQPVDRFVLDQPFPYAAKDVTLTTMLHEMAQKTQVPVIPAQGLAGRGDLDNSGGSLRDALDRLGAQGLALWWFDGAAVHVEPPEALTSRLIALQGVTMADLRGQLRTLRMDDPRWPLIGGADAQMVRLVAPQGYVQAIEAVIAALAQAQASRDAAGLPVIIRGPGRGRAAAAPVMNGPQTHMPLTNAAPRQTASPTAQPAAPQPAPTAPGARSGAIH